MDGMAYAEIIEILDNMSFEDKNKVPKKIYDFFLEKSNKNYIRHLDKNKTLYEQEIREDTKEILAILLINYWCETDYKKNQLLTLFRNNEIKYQEQLREKYNSDMFFKNKRNIDNNNNEEVESNTQMIVINKDNIFTRFIRKIKLFFKL